MPGPQPHKQLHHAVADQLCAAIQTGNLKPGEWLRQERLAQELGVSQMPVREALKELIAEGLVEHLPYRGVRVVEFSPDDVGEVYAHRSFLEGRAAFIAAKGITPEEIALMWQTAPPHSAFRTSWLSAPRCWPKTEGKPPRLAGCHPGSPLAESRRDE